MLSLHPPNLACTQPSRTIIISAPGYFLTIRRLNSYMATNTICHQENRFLFHGGQKKDYSIVQQQ